MAQVPSAGRKNALEQLNGRVLAADACARVDSPSLDASIQDGYALRSDEGRSPAPTGRSAETDSFLPPASGPDRRSNGNRHSGHDRASLPRGADAVLAGEFTVPRRRHLVPQRRRAGTQCPQRDATYRPKVVARKRRAAAPALIGLLARPLDQAPVVSLPSVAVSHGRLKWSPRASPWPPASFTPAYHETRPGSEAMAFQQSWCRIVLTAGKPSGPAEEMAADADPSSPVRGLGSERDLMVDVLEEMGWEGIFHRVRRGPGRPSLRVIPAQALLHPPGGPPSHEIGSDVGPARSSENGRLADRLSLSSRPAGTDGHGAGGLDQCLHRLHMDPRGPSPYTTQDGQRLSGMDRKDVCCS
jgi:molybdopterin molybdotransferase